MEKKLQIAMLIDCYGGQFIGGGQSHVKFLSQKLKENYNCVVDIFSQKNLQILSRWLWNIWIIPLVIIRHLKTPYQIIHAQAFSAGIAGKILAIILKVPLIYSVHGSHTLDLVALSLENKSWKYYLEKLLLTGVKYDKVISDSAHFLKYANLNKEIVVIENGVESNIKFKKPSIKDLKNKKTHLLFVGRLEKVKGVEYLLKAIVKLKNHQNIILRIVGDGSLKKQLVELRQLLHLQDKVEFVGSKTGTELEQEYAQADLFVLPSLAEGQAIAILDAWQYKIPVLVSKAGHNPWMIENGKDGFLAEVASVDSLAKTLEIALKNNAKWRDMGEYGYKKVINNYTWNITAKKTYAVYQNLLRKNK